MPVRCRYCCKSLFALLIKNAKGYRRDVRVNMWGNSSPDDKLVSDLAKATEAIKIAARRSDRRMAGKLSPLNFGLLQQYLPLADVSRCSKIPYSNTSSARCWRNHGTSRPSDLAVLRLIVSTYLTGACAGKSAGFSPLRTRSA